jgi:hypothetical protein
MSKIQDSCPECQNIVFQTVENSILKLRYSFISKMMLKVCVQCGLKYICCEKCKSILTLVHLSLDIFCLKDICQKCKHQNKLISDWIEKQKKQYNFSI